MVKKLKKVNTPELNEAYQKVLIWFFSYPYGETSLNYLSKALSISKTTAKKVVLRLEKEGFLDKRTLGKTWQIGCNPNHLYTQSKKIAYNLTMIYESDILDGIHKTIPNPESIILFGSYRKGDDTEESDIDLAVEVLGNKKLEIRPLGEYEFGYRDSVSVNLHIFSKNKIDLNLFSNIANGIVLEGFLGVRPWK